ncbi:abortive infection system antitoxin AbiGi family protein [Pseudalkalibacillus berkeleyi]|uniref:Abortive infection system antitoxin AbiGi family protein n=1 Tax=Pseudalkalibacillus berkeleyi TaxID=1069813 RepID=A0ABS9H607_9BACL|nr:abortive infection system antitoxin AbiGi family protein [Pseudalkalibacillus berkeleyi]MCF6139297.1 abortive infection system antitoxin AbiGi family protein [Pseudalkalibacillus berkeleyi]
MQRYYSRIYWHFTGSPKDGHLEAHSPDELLKVSKPKSDEESIYILLSILESSSLIASSSEQVGRHKTGNFCSTTDIPFKDLVNHSRYYGKAAIGFKAAIIHEHFLPVCYVPVNHTLLNEKLEQKHPLIDFVKVTDFHPPEGHTFYREKEWRKIGDFKFSKTDVAAIVVPDQSVKKLQTYLREHQYPENISVCSWQLVEEA